MEVNRLESRRRSAAISVHTLTREQLTATAVMNALDLLTTRANLTLQPCSERGTGFHCTLRRGQVVQPVVYIDEVRVPGGLDLLDGYNTDDFYTIENYGNGAMIRAYTVHFMDGLAKGKRRLDPVLVW